MEIKDKEITTYLVSDLKLFDAAAARTAGENIENYNRLAIQSINLKARELDYVILNGIVSVGSLISTLALLGEIKAKIIIQAENDIYPFCTQEDLRKWKKNGSFVWGLDGYCPITVMGEEGKLIIPVSKERFRAVLKEKNLYYAAPASMFPEDWSKGSIYYPDNRVLNTSYDMWHYEPINVDEISNTIDNYEVFNSMETTERRWEEER